MYHVVMEHWADQVDIVCVSEDDSVYDLVYYLNEVCADSIEHVFSIHDLDPNTMKLSPEALELVQDKLLEDAEITEEEFITDEDNFIIDEDEDEI